MSSYQVGDLVFARISDEYEDDHCCACGADVEVYKEEWTICGKEGDDVTHHVYVTEEGGFVSVSEEAYLVCDKCLKILQEEDGEQIRIRLLHQELQDSLSAFPDVTVGDREQIERAGRIKALIDLACEDC